MEQVLPRVEVPALFLVGNNIATCDVVILNLSIEVEPR